jgi:hypothetical protein
MERCPLFARKLCIAGKVEEKYIVIHITLYRYLPTKLSKRKEVMVVPQNYDPFEGFAKDTFCFFLDGVLHTNNFFAFTLDTLTHEWFAYCIDARHVPVHFCRLPIRMSSLNAVPNPAITIPTGTLRQAESCVCVCGHYNPLS